MNKNPSEKQLTNTPEKNNLHPRNLHRYRYDFEDLVKTCPELKPFVFVNKFNVESIDFANPEAVKWLNKSILIYFYSLKYWDIPTGYLCPPVPGRADYVHYLADLLSIGNKGKIPTGNKTKIIDIGMGANCIYPIIGTKEYGWEFIGTDIDPIAIQNAQKIIDSNPILEGKIELRLQKNPINIFEGIIKTDEIFDAVICNPPFHESEEEAMEGNRRKLNNLADKIGKMSFEIPIANILNNNKVESRVFQQTHLNNPNNDSSTESNFGGKPTELWCEGGEKVFIKKMIQESKNYKNQILWFTSLVSNSNHLKTIENALKNAKVAKSKIIEMTQGQKVNRFIAWTFIGKDKQEKWAQNRWK